METKRVRRFGNSTALYISAAILLVLILTFLGTNVFLKIITIDVLGDSRYSKSEIVKVSGIEAGSSIIRIDEASASQRILAAMPYIEEASITYKLPDKVFISIKESSLLLSIQYNQNKLIINPQGRVVDNTVYPELKLVEIIGFVPLEANLGSQMKASIDDETKLRHLLVVLSAIDESPLKNSVDYVDISNISRVIIGYKEHFTVIIGISSDTASKLALLEEKIAQIIASGSYNPLFRCIIDASDPSEWTWGQEAY